MLVIIAVSTILGFILIFLLKRSSTPIAMEEAYYRQDAPGTAALGEMVPEEFKEICVDLVEAVGLRVQSVESEEPGVIDITAFYDHPVLGGTYLVNGLLSPTDQVVDSAPVIGLSSAVHQERAMKGIFITTGFFSQEVDKIAEGAPVELINRDRLAELLEEYGIARMEKRLSEQNPGEHREE
ncbi:MAG: restriction endonuclease [Nitrospinota bacterium]|jgi:restriction endonuclease Mrr|nr:restriction endonuclease [Nitrospinota bacterium]HJM43750.1 restriction endonuclease [Nitrospinota bacterium]